jgi:Flp pilus assembly protein TadD
MKATRVSAIVILLLACGGLNPMTAFGADKAKAAELTQQGWAHWQKGEIAEAIAKFDQAVKADPKNENAWNGLGWASFNSGKVPEAK